MPNRAAIWGTRSATLRTAVSNGSPGRSGMPSGVTWVRTGEKATASTTAAHRA